jgi:hypothetical protein
MPQLQFENEGGRLLGGRVGGGGGSETGGGVTGGIHVHI